MELRLDSDTPALRQKIQAQRQAGHTIGFVPTMGFLHEGHTSLIEASRNAGHFTVVSVFVNPAQFGPGEDLDSYPRTAQRDFEISVACGAQLVWFPEVGDLYPVGAQTRVAPGALAQRLCGISRPQFFGGICTVVLKLFNLVTPDEAFFGQKDFQQFAIVRRMVQDFYLNVRVTGCPTVRDRDGLAKSSRNARLKPPERDQALTLYRTIRAAQAAFQAGAQDAAPLKTDLLGHWPKSIDLDYLSFRDPIQLEEVERLSGATRIFLGAWLNGVRLIDNAALAS